MTVADLIAQLQRLDPELKVVVPDENDGGIWLEAERAGTDTVQVINGRMSLSYVDEVGAVKIVRLFAPRPPRRLF